MTAYRAYLLDDDDVVLRVKVFESRSDAEAVQVAATWAAGRRYELWRGSRRINRGEAARSA